MVLQYTLHTSGTYDDCNHCACHRPSKLPRACRNNTIIVDHATRVSLSVKNVRFSLVDSISANLKLFALVAHWGIIFSLPCLIITRAQWGKEKERRRRSPSKTRMMTGRFTPLQRLTTYTSLRSHTHTIPSSSLFLSPHFYATATFPDMSNFILFWS